MGACYALAFTRHCRSGDEGGDKALLLLPEANIIFLSTVDRGGNYPQQQSQDLNLGLLFQGQNNYKILIDLKGR